MVFIRDGHIFGQIFKKLSQYFYLILKEVNFLKKFVYADNSATTFMSDKAIEAMLPFFKESFGNPSTLYSIGRESKKTLELAREKVAKVIGADPGEIFFTSGGSESDNWAIKGTAFAQKKKGKNHIITSNIEHHAVLHSVESLAKQGFEVTYVKVNENGIIDPQEVKKAINDRTGLVSIIYANNEIGTIQDIKEIGSICREYGIPFHTDAVQAIGNVNIDVNKENIDMLSMSAHKFHGPKGVGALYIKKGIKVSNFIDGGAQERGKRAGTENIAGIVGMAAALEEACKNIEEKAKKISAMRNRVINELLKIEKSRLNGDLEKRLPGNINMCFEGIEGESLILRLDMEGICGSSGSACTSGSLDPSHVLLAIGLPHEIAHGSLRLTLSEYNTQEDTEYIVNKVPGIVNYLRSISPLWEKIKKGEKYYGI